MSGPDVEGFSLFPEDRAMREQAAYKARLFTHRHTCVCPRPEHARGEFHLCECTSPAHPGEVAECLLIMNVLGLLSNARPADFFGPAARFRQRPTSP